MNDQPSLIDRTSIADQVFQYLRDGILENQFPGGQRIIEREIAERLSVSRTPVREALRKLEAEGLVIRSNSGYTAVVERTLDDMLDAFHVRIALECYAVRLATASATDEQLSRLIEFDKQIRSEGDQDEFEGKIRQGAHFHEAVVELTGNGRIAKLLNEIIEYIDLYRQRLYHEPRYLDENLVNHQHIFEAMRSRDEDQAASLMRTHLRSSMEIIRTLWEADHGPELLPEEVQNQDRMK